MGYVYSGLGWLLLTFYKDSKLALLISGLFFIAAIYEFMRSWKQ